MNPDITSKHGSFCEILYEDEAFLALNKPAGLPSQPLRENETETAVGSALAYRPALAGVGPRFMEPGLLHRLDVGTSGVLLFAKTNEAFDHWKSHWDQIQKLYRAITLNAPPSLPHTINTPIGHSLKSSKKVVVLTEKKHSRTNIRGKALEASTTINSAKHINSQYDLEIEIKKGFRHQIRAHLASENMSIVGDDLYNGAPAERLFLHAWKLIIPSGANLIEIEAPLPANWPT